MIFGIGADLVAIDRIRKSLESPAFWQRVFGPAERTFLQGLPIAGQAASAAANFAAKEAFLKAAGRGLGGFALCEIQVLRAESGAPCYALCGAAAEWLRENSLAAHLSLTHEAGLAGAFAVLEKEESAEA